MSWVHALRHRVHVRLQGEAYALEQARELETHLALAAMQHAGSESPDSAAHEAARRRLGNVTSTREAMRHAAGFASWDRFSQDVRYALRGLARTPAFTVTVVITLALGVGANSAIHSFLDRVLVQNPPGVENPDEVRRLYAEVREGWPTRRLGAAFATSAFIYQAYEAMRDASVGRADVAAHSGPETAALVTPAGRISLRADWVSQNYLRTLGVGAQLGRLFGEDEGRIDAPAYVALLSDRTWRARFGGDSGIVGQSIRIGRASYTVIGVVACDFSGIDLSAVDVFLPLNTYDGTGFGSAPWYRAGNENVEVIARIRSGSDVAFASLATPPQRRVREAWEMQANRRTIIDTVTRVVTGPIVAARGPATRAQSVAIALRLAAVALTVLIVACANIATLFLVRALKRKREIAVRLALGVTRARLAGQLMIESLVLAAIAAPCAIGVAMWGGAALRKLLMPTTNWAGWAVNLRVLLVGTGVVLLVCMVAGMVPVLQALRSDFGNALKAGARDGGYRRSAFRSGLLVAQTALSLVLLVGAGLCIRSLDNVVALPTGYQADNLILATIPGSVFDTPSEEGKQLMSVVAQRMRAIPGVRSVALSRFAPMGGNSGWRLYTPGREDMLRAGDVFPMQNSVSPEFFETSGLRFVEGRSFNDDERAVAIIDETMARAFWPGESAVGKCLMSGSANGPCTTIIGVVTTARRSRRIEAPTMHWFQNVFDVRVVLVRVDGSHTAAVRGALRNELKQTLPNGDEANIRMMNDDLERELRPWRLHASLFSAFGILALVVAAVGIYSVMAYAVGQRMHEMGIRVALGARMRDVVNLVLGDGTRVLALGVMIGAAIAIAVARVIANLLFGVTPRDPVVMIGAACLLMGVGMLASLLPALRAARVDPVRALQSE